MFLTKEKKSPLKIFGIFSVYILCSLVNLFLWRNYDNGFIYMIYPFTVHIPLLLYYVFAIKTNVCQAVFALCAAYMMTTPRKWLVMLLIYVSKKGVVQSVLSEITVSAVLILLIVKYVSPPVIEIFTENHSESKYLCLLPALSYVLSYLTTVYSDFLFKYPQVTIPVLTTVLSLFFMFFGIYFFDYSFKKIDARHSRQILDVQTRSVKRLAECLDCGGYFCENKSVNAFLSMYKSAFSAKDVLFVCDCNLTEEVDTPKILVVITSILDDALGRCVSFCGINILQKKNQISIMLKTDGECDYDKTMLCVLKMLVRENNGILYTDENKYIIQISFRRGR